MSVYIFALGIKAANGLVKSTINTANAFVENGTEVAVVNILGKNGGFDFLDPAFELNEKVTRYSLDALSEEFTSPDEKKQDFYVENQQFLKAHYHGGHKKALQLLNKNLTKNDLVIFSHPLALAIFCKANPDRQATTIIQVHGNYIEEVDNLNLIKDYIDEVDYIQTVSSYMRDDLIDLLDVSEDKVKCIYNITKPITVHRKQSGLTKRISIIGSIQKRKNQLDAIKMLNLIEDRNVVLQIFGKPLKQDYMDLLDNYIEMYGLRDRVIFQGVASEKEIYENTDVAIMTSEHEGFGYIFLEATCYNIPIVAYDFKYGAKEFTCDNQNGCLIEMGDYVKMAEVVSNLLNNPNEYQKVVTFNKENFENKYTEQLVLDSYNQLFTNINHSTQINFSQNEKLIVEVEKIECSTIKLPVKQPWQDAITEENFFNTSFEMSLDKSKAKFYYVYNKSKFPISASFKEMESVDNVEQKSSRLFRNYTQQDKISSAKKKYQISLNIPQSNRASFGEPMKQLSLGVEIGGNHCIFATISDGKIEQLNHESLCDNTKKVIGAHKINDILHILRPDGFYLRYPTFEAIKSIKNEDGEFLPFSTHILKVYGKENLFFKLKVGLYKKLTVLMNGGEKLEIDFSDFSYKSVFQRLTNLEIKHNLYDIKVFNVFAWELIRASLFEHILEATGVLDKHFGKPAAINNKYFGQKNLDSITVSNKLIFEFPRKKVVDYKTLPVQKLFISNSTILEYPQQYGYSDRAYSDSAKVYPMLEFLTFCNKHSPSVEFSGNDKNIIRWLKKIFIDEFGLDIEFSLFLKARIIKFLKEYEYFNSFFAKHKFKEVLIPSAYWSAGIIAAAKKNGVITSDIQYALISKYHPSFAFPVSARAYGSDRVYLWSKYWNIKEAPYNKSIVLETNYLKEKLQDLSIQISNNNIYDVAFVSQSRIGRKLFNFALDFAKQNPDKKIVFCPHPDELTDEYSRYNEAIGLANFIVNNELDTLILMSQSSNVVGVYSTALVEAAGLGKSVYSVTLSGHEVLEREVSKGFVNYISSLQELANAVEQKKDISQENDFGVTLYNLSN